MAKKRSVLIVGYGNIGQHILKEFANNRDIDLHIYDPWKEFSFYEDNCDIAFICVPTDKTVSGQCDTSIVEEAVKRCTAKLIVIKSTIPVGTTERLVKKYKKRIVFSPEYYGTTMQAPKSPDFVILAGERKDCDEIAQLYYTVKKANFQVRYTDYRTAELAKYMENCFLAMKVTFCAEFATIAKEKDVSYPELRELFLLDERMGRSHTFVYEEAPYYDSHCLNKDIPALVAQTGKAHLMESVERINRIKKANKDY